MEAPKLTKNALQALAYCHNDSPAHASPLTYVTVEPNKGGAPRWAEARLAMKTTGTLRDSSTTCRHRAI